MTCRNEVFPCWLCEAEYPHEIRGNAAARETIGAQVKTAPGARSVNCEPDSQGLAAATKERD